MSDFDMRHRALLKLPNRGKSWLAYEKPNFFEVLSIIELAQLSDHWVAEKTRVVGFRLHR